MAKQGTTHTQCFLRRVNGSVQTSWIPTKYAKKGRFLRLREGNAWENGWEVVETYATQLTKDVQASSQDYRHQREVSDI